MKMRLAYVFVSFMVLSLICAGYSIAQIDPGIIVGLWSLDEGDDDVAVDSSENGRDGNIQGAEWEDGKQGDALSFQKGDTVVVPLGSGTVRNQVSVVLWLKFLDLTGQQNYFSIWDSSSNRYVPYKTDAHVLRFWTNNWNIASGFTVEEDIWYHVANVYDGKTASIYVNGELKVSQPGTFTLNDNEQTSWFATDKGGWLSACVEDEIGIFSGALTADEVRSIMENGIGWALGGAAVEPSGKLTITWSGIKVQH